jgi:hypothetical protein
VPKNGHPRSRASKLNSAQGSPHVSIRATRGSPEGIEGPECPFHGSCMQFVGREPGRRDNCVYSMGSLAQRLVCRPVRFRSRVEVADNPNGQHIAPLVLRDLSQCWLPYAFTKIAAFKL